MDEMVLTQERKVKKIKVERGEVEDGKMEDSEVEAEENETKERSIWRLWLYVRNYPYFSCKCDQIPTTNTSDHSF